MPALAQPIACPKCRAILGAAQFNLGAWSPCPSCSTPLQVEVFPALFREPAVVTGERVTADTDASCFYHPEKKAAAVCDQCGRFVCALCEVEFSGKPICPSCLQSGGQKGTVAKMETGRTRHDRIALALAVLPILLFYFTLITGPAALYYSIRHWNSPGSIVPNWRRANLLIAILFSGVEVAGWIVFFVWLYLRK